jgi:hypothetical protein
VLREFENLDANDNLVWLGDNTLLIYGDFGGTDSIHFYQVVDQRRELIATVASWSHFSLSPDSRYLAIWQQEGINVLRLAIIDLIEGKTWISATPTSRSCFSALWSFDSEWLLFSGLTSAGQCNQFRIQPDGSDREPVDLPANLVSLTTTSAPYFLGRNASGDWLLVDIRRNTSQIVPGDVRTWSTGPQISEPRYGIWIATGLGLFALGLCWRICPNMLT